MRKAISILLLVFGCFVGTASAQTGSIVITATSTPASITVDRNCNYVVIQENSATPTNAFTITLPGQSTGVTYQAGYRFVFTAGPSGFNKGQTIGTISIASGSVQFIGIESDQTPTIPASARGLYFQDGGTPIGTADTINCSGCSISGTTATIVGGGSGCIPGGSAGALQKNSNPTGSCNAAALVDNGTTITASEPVVVPSLNKVVYADQEAGATADVKVAAAITALGAPGGTVDARGFGATSQLWAATVTVPQGVTINFDPKTYFGPSFAALNLFKVEPSARVDGFTLDCSSQPTYSGNVFENDPTQAYVESQNTSIDNVLILCGGVATGNGLYLSSTSSSLPVVWIRTSHWRQTGLLNQVLMTPSGNGFINDNHFLDMQMNGAGTGVTSVQFHMTPNGGQIDGNQCIQCSFQSESSTDLGWLVDGTSGANDQVSDNLFIGDCWDSTVTCVNFSGNTKAESNQYIGLSNHGISDINGSNGNYSYSNLTAVGGIFIGGFPTETGPTQITHNSSSAVSGIIGTNYCIGESKVAFLQCLDNNGNMGLAGSLYIKQNASPSNPSSGSDLLNFDTSDIFGPLTSTGASAGGKFGSLNDTGLGGSTQCVESVAGVITGTGAACAPTPSVAFRQYTASQTLTGADAGVVDMKCASACTVTLPASIPANYTSYSIEWDANAAGAVTISPNGLNMTICTNAASTSNFAMPTQGGSVYISTDGTSWFASCPAKAGTNVTIAPSSTGQIFSSSGGGAFSGGSGSSFQDASEIAAPANPSAGVDRLWLDSTSHLLACHTSAGASCMPSGGSGTVTGVTLQGTANQITVSGTCNITTSGTCTFSLPNTVLLGTDASANGQLQLSNGGALGTHTILGSAATTSNTFLFPVAVPTNLHSVYCAVSTTVCTLTDTGYAYNAIPNADLQNSATTVNGTTCTLGSTCSPTANTPNAATFNNGGAGAASGTTFDGSVARTISYNTLGAAPLASPTFTGTVTIPSGSALNTPTSINLSNATSLPCAAMPALTGDVTTSAGACATTIANNAVTGAKMANNTVTATQLAAQYSKRACPFGMGDGTNAITAATYPSSGQMLQCVNNSGVTWTITGIHCFTDNAGTSMLNVYNNAGTSLLTGAITCNATKTSGGAAGTQSATTTIANTDGINFVFVADGTSKYVTATVDFTY